MDSTRNRQTHAPDNPLLNTTTPPTAATKHTARGPRIGRDPGTGGRLRQGLGRGGSGRGLRRGRVGACVGRRGRRSGCSPQGDVTDGDPNPGAAKANTSTASAVKSAGASRLSVSSMPEATACTSPGDLAPPQGSAHPRRHVVDLGRLEVREGAAVPKVGGVVGVNGGKQGPAAGAEVEAVQLHRLVLGGRLPRRVHRKLCGGGASQADEVTDAVGELRVAGAFLQPAQQHLGVAQGEDPRGLRCGLLVRDRALGCREQPLMASTVVFGEVDRRRRDPGVRGGGMALQHPARYLRHASRSLYCPLNPTNISVESHNNAGNSGLMLVPWQL